MKKTLAAILLVLSPVFAAPAKKPKLIVAVVVDQFRYDYLTRFRAEYNGGFARLLDHGAVYTNATYQHFPTVTAVGHSTFLSGATPSVSGIVGNEWYDRESGRQVSSVSDETTLLLGVPGKYRGSSPARLPVSTVGDELKMANSASKVVSVSIKDRSAILPAGHMADGAYWFEPGVGNFVSSTFYFQKLPAWVEKFNAARSVDQYVNREWLPFDAKPGAKAYRKLGAKADKSYFDGIERTPYGNDIVEQFAEAAVEGEHLGEDAIPDLLAVSFSANDRVGHQLGPDSPEVRDISIQTDRTFGRLLKFLDDKIGADSYVVVMTADHGVAPLPEVMEQRKMPGGRMTEGSVLEAIQVTLTKVYGEGKWVVGKSGPAPYLNYQLVTEKKLSIEDVQRTAADAVRALPHIFRVYTRTDLMNGRVLDDMVGRRVLNGFNAKRSSDLFIVAEPYWLFEAGGTSHGTPYNYDAHVPIIFWGAGIKAGRYTRPIAVNDIAPTLTTLFDVETPSGSSGIPLPEILQ